MLLQQGHGPRDGLIAKVLRPPLQTGHERCLEVIGPQAGVIAPALIDQGGRVGRLFIARNPMVDAHPRGPEHAGDLSDGATVGRLQDRQSTPKEPSVTRLA